MNDASNLFLDLVDMEVTPCQCAEYTITPGMQPDDPDTGSCVCGREERILRAYAKGSGPRLMTPEERAWCVGEVDRAGEGAYDRLWLATLEDRELARMVLQAWKEYAESQGLL